MESHGLFLFIINSDFIAMFIMDVFNVIMFTFLHETTVLHCNGEGLIVTCLHDIFT